MIGLSFPELELAGTSRFLLALSEKLLTFNTATLPVASPIIYATSDTLFVVGPVNTSAKKQRFKNSHYEVNN
ncbi:hypothetical protein JTB14_030195 [Gonioctena quinquepunctata]|nr:hypothetical protein JTB14_030195 [Gonioctena quinquepunctata]